MVIIMFKPNAYWKMAVAAVSLQAMSSFGGIYSGSTDDITFNSLAAQVETKYTDLVNKIAEANAAGVNTDYAQTSKVTLELFKDVYVPWDRANQATLNTWYYNNPTWQANSVHWITQFDPYYPDGPLYLPFDELADCIELADAAIAELNQQIAGTITLQHPPDFASGDVILNGTKYELNGRAVIPHYFFWHPFDEDLMQAYGRSGEGYYAITDMSGSNTVKNANMNNLRNLTINQGAAHRGPQQFFLGHQVGNAAWQRTAVPDAFNVGHRLFTHYDIDHPVVRPWLDEVFVKQLKPSTDVSTTARVHMIANEPVFAIRQGGVHASNGLSSYTFDKFEAWLQAKYGNIATLNSTYGTGYADFATAATANYVSNSGVSTTLQGGPIWYDWCRFNMDRVTDWFTYLQDGVKSVDPHGKTHIKVMGERSIHTKYQDEGIDFEVVSKMVDLPGADNQMTSGRAEYEDRLHLSDWENRYCMEWVEQSIMIDFVKSMSPDKSYYDSEWHGLSGARWRDYHMEPAYVRAALWMACTHGMASVNAWMWGRKADGSIDTRADFIGTTLTQPLQLDAWGRSMKELNAHGDRVASLVPDQRYYMVYYCKDAAIQDPDYTEEMSDVYEALKLLNVPVGFTTPTELSTLDSSVQTLIVPPTKYISDTDLAGLQAFAATGGKIVLVEPSVAFLKDELGVARGSSGLTPYSTLPFSGILNMAGVLETALASRKPSLPVSADVTSIGGASATGVMLSQYTDPVTGNQVASLINLSKDSREVALLEDGGTPTNVVNLLTGNSSPTFFTMEPMDVLLLEFREPASLPPSFSKDPINLTDADEGTEYVGSIAPYASDPEEDMMSFSKLTGPGWLLVATNGLLSGTPSRTDIGANAFTVEVAADDGSSSATLNIQVYTTTPFWNDYIAMYGLTGIPTNDFDLDGVDDWAEYVSGGDPKNGEDTGIPPVIDVVNGKYELQLRNDSNLVAHVISTTNLIDGLWMTNDTVNVTTHDGAMAAHVSAINMLDPQLFIKTVVEGIPIPPVTITHQVIIGEGGSIGVASSGNGNFENESSSSGVLSFANTAHWYNLDGSDAAENFSDDTGFIGSPEPNSRGAFLSGNLAANDMGYTVLAAGETFSVSLALHKFGGGYNGDEVVHVDLFTSSSGVDADTSIGDITIVGSTSFNVSGSWTSESATAFYTTTQADVGKTIYLGLSLANPDGSAVFPRIDVVKLEVNKP